MRDFAEVTASSRWVDWCWRWSRWFEVQRSRLWVQETRWNGKSCGQEGENEKGLLRLDTSHLKHFCFNGLTGSVFTLRGLSIFWFVQYWVCAPTSRLNSAIFAFRLLKILLSRCWLPEIWVILEKVGVYMWLCSRCKALLVVMLYFQSGPVDRLYWTKLCPLHQTSRVFVSPKPQRLFLCAAALCALRGCCMCHWITLFTMWGGYGRSSSWSFTNGDKWFSTCLSCHDAQPASSAEKGLMTRQLVSNLCSVLTHWLCFSGWILPLLLQVLSLDAAAIFVLEYCSWKKFWTCNMEFMLSTLQYLWLGLLCPTELTSHVNIMTLIN